MKSSHTNYRILISIIAGSIVMAAGFILFDQTYGFGRYFAAYVNSTVAQANLVVQYPFEGTLFPPEICPPTVRWQDQTAGVKKWLVVVSSESGKERIHTYTSKMQWIPTDLQWQRIKQASVTRNATIVIIGIQWYKPVSCGQVTIRTSTDSVGAPLFYREVILPFKDAVKDPSKIRWRFGSITKKTRPPVVLENLPVCGNCHSFSADGKIVGMDVDYANDKGSYAITPLDTYMTLDSSDIISWSEYRKEDTIPTFGLLSQVSPDGEWVASTVKDHSVFVPKPELAFSQLFFPIKGIIAVYNRTTRTFSELPGANDRRFVQSNPVWSPDAQNVLFIRSEAYALHSDSKQILLTEEECAEFLKNGKQFLYDIYQVPFNQGKGGEAKPLIGASHNGMSNYFPRYSPDGRWIVFCKAKSFSLLQPDSRLYIMPAKGGEPRLMRCNRNLMNSWHSWSPNGKWLVFSSKDFSPYTQLFLTHIDENGMDSPPVALDWLTAPDRAANIPEFVNATDTAIVRIKEHFVDDISYLRAAREYIAAYDFNDSILHLYQKALAINPRNAQAHYGLGTVLSMQNKQDEAEEHFKKAIQLDSTFLLAYSNLATVYAYQGRIDEAEMLYGKVVEHPAAKTLVPKTVPHEQNTGNKETRQALVNAYTNLALIYVNRGANEGAIHMYEAAIATDPFMPDLYCELGDILMLVNNWKRALVELNRAIGLKPDFERAYFNLGIVYEKMGLVEKAVDAWENVLKINPENADAWKNIRVVRERVH